jgi:methylated-DNA-protein-cysteine methyltransferase-like protein
MQNSKLLDFKKAVYDLVRSIPKGKVMTYGQIAGLLGYPRAAQMVGWIMHWSDHHQIPYQRVVNRFGGLASGYTRGGREAHKKDLEDDGIKVRKDYTVDLGKYLHKSEIKFEKVK